MEIIAKTKYWPVDVNDEAALEFIQTRQELSEQDSGLSKLPLLIDDDKFMGRDVNDELTVVFVSDPGEDELGLADRLDKAAKALAKKLKKSNLDKVIKNYETIIEPSVITRLKIALVGEGGVGKTTTLHLLMGDTPPLQYVPTIALNLETVENIRFGNYSLVLWDFAGQERFRKLWRFYFHGADVIFLICDSSLRNVIVSKDILKLIKRDAPKVPLFCMANKQDKPTAMRPEVVQKILGVPTYPMVAIDISRRDEMLRILLNAAAQYIGVVLPDLPASELLRFTDEATEEAVAGYDDDDDDDDEYEYVEVLVDEDGEVIEDGEEYEIIEEEVKAEDDEVDKEIVDKVEEKDDLESEEDEEEEEDDDDDEIEIRTVGQPIVAVEDITDEPEIVEPAVDAVIHEAELPIDASSKVVYEAEEFDEREVEVTEEISSEDTAESPVDISEDETPSLVDDPEILEEAVELPIDTPLVDPVGVEDIESEQIPSEVSKEEPSEEVTLDITKELISEALDADEIINAEIDRVPKEELDHAIEAFSSQEVTLLEGEDDKHDEIPSETMKELDDILGSIESMFGATAETEADETEDSDDELDELDAMFASMDDSDE